MKAFQPITNLYTAEVDSPRHRINWSTAISQLVYVPGRLSFNQLSFIKGAPLFGEAQPTNVFSYLHAAIRFSYHVFMKANKPT